MKNVCDKVSPAYDVRRAVTRNLVPLLTVAFLGCGESAIAPTGNVLEFVEREVELENITDADHATHIFQFHIGGDEPIVISSVETSCGCLLVDDSLVGQELLPGFDYKLPVSIEVYGKVEFSERILVQTTDGVSAYLKVSGVNETQPKPDPTQIVCQYSRPYVDQEAKSFLIHRYRRKETEPLVPNGREWATENLLIQYITGEVGEVVGRRSDVVRDLLEFKWKFKTPPRSELSQSIEISWNDPTVPKTKVEFLIVEQPSVPGLAKELYCGDLSAGQTWNHTVTLYLPDNQQQGTTVRAKPVSDRLSVTVERVKSFTLLHLKLKAPEKIGAIDEAFEIELPASNGVVETVRIVGFVVANN